MNNDIEHLLATAADDADRPLSNDVDDLLLRARRSVRRSRIATASTAILTTAAIIGGVAAWSANRPESADPAGKPGRTITIDVKTGRIIADETGKAVIPPPPASPLSDAEVLRRCEPIDREALEHAARHQNRTVDNTGPIDARWKVVVKSGDRSVLSAMFLAPDQSVVATCSMRTATKPAQYGRVSATMLVRKAGRDFSQAVEEGIRVPVAGVTRVLIDRSGESTPREALVGSAGFFSLGFNNGNPLPGTVDRIRGYDDAGEKVFELNNKPDTAPRRTVDPSVTVKTAEPITPQVVLTDDPLTGKALAPPPPVSPLTDDQITTRCRGVDDIYFKDLARGRSNADNGVIKAAGPVTKDWQVALKTGTGDRLTAVLISPDKRVYAWCHMLTPTAKGAYDYTRGAVQADGKFAHSFDFAMVPDGVAQIVVDLPKGPTRALMSNGYFIWGLTGGNSGIRSVRVRGYDTQGKQVYNQQMDVDADFG